jgi:hypothetical protein
VHSLGPAVEIADQTHAPGVWSPHRKVSTCLAFDNRRVRPKLFPEAVVGALIEEVKVIVGQRAAGDG